MLVTARTYGNSQPSEQRKADLAAQKLRVDNTGSCCLFH